jgi:hypothetical protein
MHQLRTIKNLRSHYWTLQIQVIQRRHDRSRHIRRGEPVIDRLLGKGVHASNLMKNKYQISESAMIQMENDYLKERIELLKNEVKYLKEKLLSYEEVSREGYNGEQKERIKI